MHKATNCILERVSIKNVASGGFGAVIGVDNGATEGILNFDNKIIDCDFDGHAGTLEMLLIFNARNTQVIRPKFINNDVGPCFGLWQKCYGTKIESPYFKDNKGRCFYYSVTTENTVISDLYAENCGTAIDGANGSDNGLFGETQSKNLQIINPIIIGGANSTNAAGIHLGGVNNVLINNPIIQKTQIGIQISTGNAGVSAGATNWSIINPQISNCNVTNDFYVLHPGILFGGIGGSLYGKIIGGNIYDDLNGYQAYPISFDGAFTWDNINIVHNRLSKSGGGTSIVLADGAALGANVKIANNQDYTGTNPAQN